MGQGRRRWAAVGHAQQEGSHERERDDAANVIERERERREKTEREQWEVGLTG